VIQECKSTGFAYHKHTHEHLGASSDFETWSYTSDQPFCIETLREMVRRELPASIYRCKGIVFTTEAPEMRVALQTVGRRTEISELDEWGERSPLTQIVAIGAGIDAQELDEKFAACIAPP
jgi:G3E family GTPase